MHIQGRDEALGTACSDHELIVALQGAVIGDPKAVLGGPQWVEAGGGRARVQRRLTSEKP
ncbi:hypothetical protein [Streptomyces sp. NPDC020362]|uniref:hypothetical protein n=1 Tax=Streptomyces sp. NPDC020362 TaxID=3154486 RepID=UPI000A5F0787